MKERVNKVVILLLAAVSALSMIGCKNMSDSPSTESVTGKSTSVSVDNERNITSEKVGITIGESVDFASFDPDGIGDGQGFYHYSKLVYETLINYKDGKPIPALAESWENKGNSWTFKLRKGVTFSDGASFNAEAVKINIESLQTNMMDLISYFRGVAGITSVEVVDEYTVTFHYDQPYFAVLQDLSAIPFGMISPNLFANGNVPYGNVLTETAGTGPYVLNAENINTGISYIFVKNENYYGENNGPEKFTVKIIPDEDSRMMALQSGEIDLLYGSYQITYDMYDYLSGLRGIEAISSSGGYATRNLLMNTTSDLLSDKAVREAIEYGTNKEQINNTVLYGIEKVADKLFPETMAYCDVEQTIYKYDPQKARSLLDKAGWMETNSAGIRIKNGNPLSINVIYMSERATDEQILMAFKGQMAEIGIEVNIQGYETMTWFKNALAGNFDITVNDTYGFPQDPNVFIAAMLDTGADNPAQQGLPEKTQIDAKINAMLSSNDEKVIQDAFTYVLTTLADEAVNVPITNIRELAVYNSEKIQGVRFSDDPACFDVTALVLK